MTDPVGLDIVLMTVQVGLNIVLILFLTTTLDVQSFTLILLSHKLLSIGARHKS